MSSYYELLFLEASQNGLPELMAADLAATAFLSGKPSRRGRKKITAIERHELFWAADFLLVLPKEVWMQESLVLALTRYLGQSGFAYPAIVAHVAALAPEALQRAARYSGLVLQQESPRWREVEALAGKYPKDFGEFFELFGIFRQAHHDRIAMVERLRKHLADLTPLDLLAYASLYAFERLIPKLLEDRQGPEEPSHHETWDAIEAILDWNLSTCDPASLRLSDHAIAASLGRHLSPFLFPSQDGPPPRHDLYGAFSALVDAQIELNSFIVHSAEAFSYDDSIRFIRQGEQMEIVEIDAEARVAWLRDDEKLIRLHQYWLYRGMEALMASPEKLALVSPAHLDANLQAFSKAMATWLRLRDVYGVGEHVQTETGLPVNVFQALLASELMTAFYIEDFLQPYQRYLQQFGHSLRALGCLAFGGLLQAEMHNRFPITWSDRATKIARIMPWTVSPDYPQGDAKAAEAILDFWTSDWIALADQLRGSNAGLRPRLHERPMLKMGRHLFQLPWMMAVQNNATAAINNVRRLGARRTDARDETRRIEQRLGGLFHQRGFHVLVSHTLPALSADDPDAEEIDLICARDRQLLVLELKSSYLRRSMRESWTHRTSTLRKAGLQLHRKVEAVRRALEGGGEMRQVLGLENEGQPEITAWIVDTSIEWDHQRFHGFLKVSLEEVQIALRDERHWLNDPDGLFQTETLRGQVSACDPEGAPHKSLYPSGFSAVSFIEVIEQASVWSA